MPKKFIITTLVIYLIALSITQTIHAMYIPCGVTEIAGSPFTDGIFNPQQLVFSPDSKWLAVANFSSSTVSIFSVNATTCQLTFVSSVPTGGLQPIGVTYSPDGTCLAVGNFISSDISIFTVNPTTGAITLLGAPVPTGGLQPVGIAYSPNGDCFAVANEFDTIPFTGNGSVSIFSVDPVTCAITLVGAPVTTGVLNPVSVDYSPDSTCLAIANFDVFGSSGSVSVFSVNPLTCSITLVGAPFMTGDMHPASAVYSPNGMCLAISNTNLLDLSGGSVSIFSVDQDTCFLTEVGLALPTGGSTPFPLTFSPDGLCLAVVNSRSNNFTIFSVNPTTCIINPIGSPIPAGSFPFFAAYSPDNKCLAISNSGFDPLVGPTGPLGSISVFQTNFIDPSLLANQSPIVKAIFAKYCPVCALIT